jgi:hypothetical protein
LPAAPPTLSLRPFAMYVAFLRSDYSGPFDCLQGLGVSVQVSPASFPLSFTSLAGSPVFSMEDSNKMMEVACCELPHPLSAAPQYRHRVNRCVCASDHMARESMWWTVLPRQALGFGLDWLAS